MELGHPGSMPVSSNNLRPVVPSTLLAIAVVFAAVGSREIVVAEERPALSTLGSALPA